VCRLTKYVRTGRSQIGWDAGQLGYPGAALTTDLIDRGADQRASSAAPKKDTHANESLKAGIEWAHHPATEVGLRQ